MQYVNTSVNKFKSSEFLTKNDLRATFQEIFSITSAKCWIWFYNNLSSSCVHECLSRWSLITALIMPKPSMYHSDIIIHASR